MEDDNKQNIKPLFDDSPSDRSQEIIIPEEPQASLPTSLPSKKKEAKTSPKTELKSHKDIPQQTRSSRVTRALLKLNDKDRKIVKGLTEGKEDKEVLESVGYSPSYISSEGKKIINKPAIQSTLAIIMENTGITDEFLAGKLKEGMDSTKMHGVGPDSKEVKDMPTRHKYIETSLKLKGHLDKKVDIVHHKSHEDQLRELQGGDIVEADYEEILPD